MRLKLYLYLALLSIIVIVERPWIGVALIAAIASGALCTVLIRVAGRSSRSDYRFLP